MSIKNNTTSLQSLLEQVNALPEAENLDAELSTQTELISEQDTIIADIIEALASKAGGGSVSYDTCTLQINNQSDVPCALTYISVEDDKIITKSINDIPSSFTITCLCNSILYFGFNGNNGAAISSNRKLQQINTLYGMAFVYSVNASVNEMVNVDITPHTSGGGE